MNQIAKLIPAKLPDKPKDKYNIQTRNFSATSHVVSLIYAQLAHALSLNDICDGMRNYNGLAYANNTRTANMAE